MSFKFNFSTPVENDKPTAECLEERQENTDAEKKDSAVQHQATHTGEIPLVWQDFIGDTETIVLQNKECVFTVCVKAIEEHLKIDEAEGEKKKDESVLLQAISENSDLIPHVYEGGMAIWECSYDLTEYLTSLDIAFRGLKVLELGCGAAIPGLYTFRQGAEVHFQDYNIEVLNHITIPNVLLNIGEDEEKEDVEKRSKFLSGAWSDLKDLYADGLKDHRYDIILTSETVYSREYYGELHDILAAVLKPTGKIYLAAKLHYFGVGGGTRDFEEYVKERGTFSIEVCKEYSEGVKREIMLMEFAGEQS